MCFVIGDSRAVRDSYLVERWLGELALAAGFKRFSSFEKLVTETRAEEPERYPRLHEGRLWVEG